MKVEINCLYHIYAYLLLLMRRTLRSKTQMYLKREANLMLKCLSQLQRFTKIIIQDDADMIIFKEITRKNPSQRYQKQ